MAPFTGVFQERDQCAVAQVAHHWSGRVMTSRYRGPVSLHGYAALSECNLEGTNLALFAAVALVVLAIVPAVEAGAPSMAMSLLRHVGISLDQSSVRTRPVGIRRRSCPQRRGGRSVRSR